ncbi:MAG: hypothetical protein J6A59_09505 [Lachnospiraceae bacterium]|nr:hypothetical protein [Lachnospiraceae bacterium]
MSDQNNQQGYVQGGQPQGYPQQNVQMNQQPYGQGYPQQGQMNQQGYMQGGHPQGYPQQNVQMNQQGYGQGYPQQGQMNQQPYGQGYPQQAQMGQNMMQGYQRPTGGGRPPQPKKSKTGLIVGIVIAAIALIAGIILLVFKDKIFGDDEKKKEPTTTEFTYEPTVTDATTEEPDTEEPTTEIAIETTGGYDTYQEVLENFWEGYEYCDKDQIYSCFYTDYPDCANDAETMYNSSLNNDAAITVHYDELQVTYEDGGEDGLVDFGMAVIDAKTYTAGVPMTQNVNGIDYEIIDKYDGVVMQLENGKWYVAYQNSLGADIISIGGEPVDNGGSNTDPGTTTNNGGSSDVDETMYLGYGDLKTMGDSTCGYVDVPSDWVDFYEAGGIEAAEATCQMASPDASAIITMCVFDNGMTAYDYASALYDTMLADSEATDVKTAQVKIGGYDAYQVYATYGTGYLITYSFEAEDGKLHYVAVEMPESMATIVFNIEGTYRLTE